MKEMTKDLEVKKKAKEDGKPPTDTADEEVEGDKERNLAKAALSIAELSECALRYSIFTD